MVSESETVNPLESVTTSLTSVYPDMFSVPSSSAPVVWLSAYISPQKAAIFDMDAPYMAFTLDGVTLSVEAP